jgi:hypothetical protein
MEKINKSCKNKSCCMKCDKVWLNGGCKNQCDRECKNCSCQETGYTHDGGWYND